MTIITAGIDVGSSAIKTVVVRHGEGGRHEILARRVDRLRQRDVKDLITTGYAETLRLAGVKEGGVAYVATTGEGELVDFRTGHFYGMTAHARGGVALVPEARAVIDIGALHTRAMVVDERGRVIRYRMTSQCASGSGQFLENIGRYLGVATEELGTLSLTAKKPEKCSSICAVLAETDVINMVSRGIPVNDIVKGIHLSMAGRFVKLLEASGAKGIVAVTGGLAVDVGLAAALEEEADRSKAGLSFVCGKDSVLAGALGAALWARYRLEKLAALGMAEVLVAS
jgi:benzoyl-CoA reductase subunit D